MKTDSSGGEAAPLADSDTDKYTQTNTLTHWVSSSAHAAISLVLSTKQSKKGRNRPGTGLSAGLEEEAEAARGAEGASTGVDEADATAEVVAEGAGERELAREPVDLEPLRPVRPLYFQQDVLDHLKHGQFMINSRRGQTSRTELKPSLEARNCIRDRLSRGETCASRWSY